MLTLQRDSEAWDFFLAHSSATNAAAEELYELLAPHARVFLDRRCLFPGDNWNARLGAAQRNSRATVAMISTGTDTSGYLMEEITRAIDMARNDAASHRIVPVYVDDGPPHAMQAPYGLAQIQALSLRHDGGLAGVASLVLKTLEGQSEPAAARSRKAYGSTEYALARLHVQPISFRREALIEDVVSRLRERSLPTVHLQGLPGIGKTTLMCQVVDRLRSEFEYMLPLVLEGPAALEPAYILEELNALLTPLGRSLEPGRLRISDERRVLAELASRLVGLRALVLIDSADQAESTWSGEILRAFSGLLDTRVLVTTRVRLLDAAAAHVVAVPPLALSEAMMFIKERAELLGISVDDRALVEQLPESLWSHPQVLAMVLSRLKDLPLEFISVGSVPDWPLAPTLMLRQTLSALGPATRDALALLAVLSDLEIAKALACLALPIAPMLAREIPELLRRSLAIRSSTGYSISSLVVDALAAADRRALSAQLENLVHAWCGAMTKSTPGNQQTSIIAELGARLGTICSRYAEWRLADALAQEQLLEVLNVGGYWKEYSLLLRVGIEAAQRVGDHRAQVQRGCRLARKLLQMGNVEEASGIFAGFEHLVADSDATLRADVLSHRAILRAFHGDEDGALADLDESRHLHAATGNDKGRAIVAYLTGNIRMRQRSFPAARGCFEVALACFNSELPSKELIDVQTSLAQCDLGENQFGAAEKRLRAALAQCSQIGYVAGRPRAQLFLALVMERLGGVGEAFDLSQRAAEEAGLNNPRISRLAAMVSERLHRRSN